MVILPLRAIKNVVRKGFVYTISAYVHAFRFAFSCILYCIQHHFTLHLAPKRTAFSIKTHCIQHQNALHFVPKHTAFSTKTHFILLQITQKRVVVAVGLNKNSFCLHSQATPFSIKTNLRENRFFAARWAVGCRKGHSEC